MTEDKVFHEPYHQWDDQIGYFTTLFVKTTPVKPLRYFSAEHIAWRFIETTKAFSACKSDIFNARKADRNNKEALIQIKNTYLNSVRAELSKIKSQKKIMNEIAELRAKSCEKHELDLPHAHTLYAFWYAMAISENIDAVVKVLDKDLQTFIDSGKPAVHPLNEKCESTNCSVKSCHVLDKYLKPSLWESIVSWFKGLFGK